MKWWWRYSILKMGCLAVISWFGEHFCQVSLNKDTLQNCLGILEISHTFIPYNDLHSNLHILAKKCRYNLGFKV